MAKDKRVPRSNQRVRRCPPSTLECPEANRQPSLSWVDETGCSVYRASACQCWCSSLPGFPGSASQLPSAQQICPSTIPIGQIRGTLPFSLAHRTKPVRTTTLSLSAILPYFAASWISLTLQTIEATTLTATALLALSSLRACLLPARRATDAPPPKLSAMNKAGEFGWNRDYVN